MNCELVQSRLDEYCDGELNPTERRAVEDHLNGCESCREELRRVRALVDRARALRHDLQPSQDLWPRIAHDIAGRRRDRRVLLPLRSAVPSRRMRMTMIVSACLLLAVGIWIVVRGLPDSGSGRIVEVPDTVETILDPTPSLAEQSVYLRVRKRLETTFEQQKSALSPKTMNVIEKNLKVIDDALDEINGALADDPGNPNLKLMLVATRKQAVDLLERATSLPTQL